MIFYGEFHSYFPIWYAPDRDIRRMTNTRVLRSRYSPPLQAAKGSVSKQLLDDERFLAKHLQKSFCDTSFFFSCFSSSSSSSSSSYSSSSSSSFFQTKPRFQQQLDIGCCSLYVVIRRRTIF